MELSEIDDEAIDLLSTIRLDDMFPKSIFYPPLSDLTELSDLSLKSDDSESAPCNYQFDSQVKKIDFKTENATIHDVKTLFNILGVCGGAFLKIYDLETYDELLFFKVPKGNLYALALQEVKECQIYCVIGGEDPVIRIINLIEGNEEFQLIGHRSDVYDLKFSPKDFGILLSSSKDCTIRLWNIINHNQLCIFGGPNGHLADVLSIDWHMTGELLVSAGIDNTVKLYAITKQMQERIDKSKQRDVIIKTLLRNRPLFSCSEVHHDYVDCVRFNGNFVISKSVDGIIKEWLPMLKEEGHYYFLVNTYIYSCSEKILNVKFEFEMEKKMLFIGSDNGEISLFNLAECEKENPKDEFHFSNSPSAIFDTKKPDLIRSIAYSDAYQCVIAGSNKGELTIININAETGKQKSQIELKKSTNKKQKK